MGQDLAQVLPDLFGTWYERSDEESLGPGHICWALVPFLLEGRPQFVHFDYDAANRGEPVQCSIGPQKQDTFNHRPVVPAPYTLEASEALVVLRAKRRPVILLSEPLQFVGRLRKDFPPSVVACPIYSFKDHHIPEFRSRVIALEYPSVFYVPDGRDFPEGFVRFDRVIMLPTGYLQKSGVRLASEALALLREHFWWFLTGIQGEELKALRSLIQESARPGGP